MPTPLPRVPRYRLDDQSPWLLGIDPLHRYWILVNGNGSLVAAIPGLNSPNLDQFREAIFQVRQLGAGESMQLPTETGRCLTIHGISENCFALEDRVKNAPVWHLFDQESLESLMMTAHPDWVCAPQHVELGRQMLSVAWGQPAFEQKVA